MSRPSFAVVYHRAPLLEGVDSGTPESIAQRSPNGIIPTLRAIFADGRDGLWVASTRIDGSAQTELRHAVADVSLGDGIDVRGVPLTASQIETFYHRFCKEALWPILCCSPADIHFEESEWDDFVDVNTRFADAVAELVEADATVWIHDYNLWLVPGVLRALLPAARIGFFHHTPFPAADVFAILPWREEIVRSLLACDLVGFHLPHYSDNFAATAANLVGASVTRRRPVADRFLTTGTPLSTPTMVAELELDELRVSLGAFPAPVDSSGIDALLATDAHARRVEAIGRELPGQRIVLAVERLDYVKGTEEKLLACERLLEAYPEYHGILSFVLVLAPAADGMSVYRAVREEVEGIVGRINGRFSSLTWTPVRYFYRPLSFERVVSWYAAASIAWITPLRDGLNLVAKEFVAVSGDAPKALVLSEFAGAHAELQHAIGVNPYSPRSMDRALRIALEMSDKESLRRMTTMNRIVRANTPQRWTAEFLAALAPGAGAGVMQTPLATTSSAPGPVPSGSS